MGIEPTHPAWKAGILPLNNTRLWNVYYHIITLRICQGLSEIFFFPACEVPAGKTGFRYVDAKTFLLFIKFFCKSVDKENFL